MNYIKIFNTFIFLLFVLFGAYLLYTFLSKGEWVEVKTHIANGNYIVVWPALAVSILVYIIRTLRWNLLLNAAEQKTTFSNTFIATSFAYGISFFVPRLGEVFRCTWQKEKQQIPLAISLGTVLLERIVDVVMLLLLISLTIILQYEKVYTFFYHDMWKAGFENTFYNLYNNWVWLLLIIMVLAFLMYYSYVKLIKYNFFANFISGLRSIISLKQKNKFILYTLLIWICYYLLTYCWFYLFPETSSLTLLAGLTICTIGTIGRSIPISGGGMGAYHYLVGAALVLYSVPSSYGKALAMVIHGGQTAFTFLMCVVGLGLIGIRSK
ncbi:MAG: lysylphosphatidylglycerol synthase transmembrane domain-containing protein [Bacteroidota bacterium]|nr:lysylphosphatidylglycerol synthase transmembrane domain-containing protein [Bacteroidota bacterium]